MKLIARSIQLQNMFNNASKKANRSLRNYLL